MMNTEATPEPKRSSGEKIEKIAFQFCKIATVALILGRFTLAVASTLAAVLFLSAWLKGKKDTRCWARYPLLLSAFWSIVAIISWTLIFNPQLRDTIANTFRSWF
jgi:hypothetical protein